MKIRKGDVDLITLVVGMVPMILFIILSGYILVENPVETDLGNQISFEEGQFESIMALSHVLVYNDTMERINRYSEFPADPDNMKEIIHDDINESTSYIGDTSEETQNEQTSDTSRGRTGRNTGRTTTRGGRTSYRGRTGRNVDNSLSDWMDRKFMVNVTMPEEDNISVSTPDTSGAFISSKAHIASPKPEPITVKVVLDRS